MSYAIVTDSTANLSKKQLEENGVVAIPFSYFLDEEEQYCEDLDQFDDKQYYEAIRNGAKVTTSQINPQIYIEWMEPLLESGKDILFIGISSGISGSFASAEMARNQLLEKYPERKIELIDSLGAGLGEGLLVLKAAKCRNNEMELSETAERIRSFRKRVYQVFIVDDLMYLKRTGRLSDVSAVVGTVLGIKPLLKGSDEGKIVAFEKVRGRKKCIRTMAEKCISLAHNPKQQTIGITYADCREDAEYLANRIREELEPKEIILQKHEPATASHLGPGALALFFAGDEDVRLK